MTRPAILRAPTMFMWVPGLIIGLMLVGLMFGRLMCRYDR